MKLLIRCDANKAIATGHVKRCLSIGNAARKLGIEVMFATASSEAIEYIEPDYKWVKFDNEYDDFDSEEDAMERLIKEYEPDVLLIDSYAAKAHYMERMSGLVKTAYMDDVYEQVWPCDAIINYSIVADKLPYYSDYIGKQIIIGGKYMPINEAYQNEPKHDASRAVKNVLVVTGGSDELHFMKNFIETLKLEFQEANRFANINFLLIAGRFNGDLERLYELASDVPNVTVESSLPSLVEAMGNADILISAAGTTLYEMAILGVPGIMFKLIDNQSENIEGFSREGLALYAGDVRYDFSYRGVFDLLEKLISDEKLRIDMSERQKKLIDGMGATNIVKALFNMED